MILWFLSVWTKIKGILDFHLAFHQEDVVLLWEHLSPENALETSFGALTSSRGGGAWVKDKHIRSRLAIKHWLPSANPTWQRSKTSLMNSQHSHLAIIWATESKPWLVAMWMQKFRWLYLWIFFHGEHLNHQLFQLCGWHKLFLGAPLLTEQTGVNLLSRRPPLLVRLQQREGALERKRWILVLPKSELRDLV